MIVTAKMIREARTRCYLREREHVVRAATVEDQEAEDRAVAENRNDKVLQDLLDLYQKTVRVNVKLPTGTVQMTLSDAREKHLFYAQFYRHAGINHGPDKYRSICYAYVDAIQQGDENKFDTEHHGVAIDETLFQEP